MSFTKTALIAAGMSMALLTGAVAQNLEPWDIREHTAYVITMDGKTMRVSMSDKGMETLMKGAKRVPRGTVFVMSGSQLYMINAAKMFDRAGNFMAGGVTSSAPGPSPPARTASFASYVTRRPPAR